MIIVANRKNRVPTHKILKNLILKSAVSSPIDIDNCNSWAQDVGCDSSSDSVASLDFLARFECNEKTIKDHFRTLC